MKFDKIYKILSEGKSMPRVGHTIVSKNISNKVEKIFFYWDAKGKGSGVPKNYHDLTDWDIYQETITLKDVEFEKRGKQNVAILWVFAPEKTSHMTIQNAVNSFKGKFLGVNDYKFQLLGKDEPELT